MVDPARLIEGTYCLTRNENFKEYLMAQGIDEDKAREVDQLKPLLKITMKEKDVTISTEMGSNSTISTLRLGEEVEERIALDMKIKSFSTLEDRKLIIRSIGPKGEVGRREFQFSDSGMIMTLSSDFADVPQAKRFYERNVFD